MSGIVERLRNISRGDHERGCQGREYICSCDYDETSWKTAEEAADEITRLRRELEEARRALEPLRELVERAQAIISTSTYPNWHAATETALRAGEEGK